MPPQPHEHPVHEGYSDSSQPKFKPSPKAPGPELRVRRSCLEDAGFPLCSAVLKLCHPFSVSAVIIVGKAEWKRLV